MRPIFYCALGAAMALLAGCSESPSHAGIEGTGDTVTASGTVTALGSIYVNGIHFETDSASVQINGQPGREDQLQAGMVVYVEGTVDDEQTGDASLVRFDHLLRGPVESIDEQESADIVVSILGQTVRITDETNFSDEMLYSITEGDELSISGYHDERHNITATYVANSASTSSVKLGGRITDIDSSILELTLRDQRVQFAQATISQGTLEDLTPGQTVEVTGELEGGVVKATSVRVYQPAPRLPGSLIALEGVISEFNSSASFTVLDVPVNAESAAISKGSADSLAAGRRVVIRGRYNSSGTLQAETLHLFDTDPSRFTGTVEDVSTETGEITVAGTTFTTSVLTAFDDKSVLPERYFKLEHIALGDQVVVFAQRQGEQWAATRIRRIPLDAQTEIQGEVEAWISPVAFSVSGVMVNAENISNPELLKSLYPGKLVGINGHYTGIMHFEASSITIYRKDWCDHYWDKYCHQ